MPAKQNITGIILAGGRSKRMGNDKANVLYKGKKLIDYPISLLSSYCDDLIISSDSGRLEEYSYPKIQDEKGKFGPLSGIYSCLKASKNDCNIVISCDMPLISSKMIEYLIENSEGFDLVMPYHNSYYEPLCGIYRKSLLPYIENLFEQNDFSPLTLIPIVNINKLEIDHRLDFYFRDIFKNINTVQDLGS